VLFKDLNLLQIRNSWFVDIQILNLN